MSIVRYTLEEVRSFPPLSEERIREIEAHVDTDFSHCPPLTAEQLKNAKRGYELHPEWYQD